MVRKGLEDHTAKFEETALGHGEPMQALKQWFNVMKFWLAIYKPSGLVLHQL